MNKKSQAKTISAFCFVIVGVDVVVAVVVIDDVVVAGVVVVIGVVCLNPTLDNRCQSWRKRGRVFQFGSPKKLSAVRPNKAHCLGRSVALRDI